MRDAHEILMSLHAVARHYAAEHRRMPPQFAVSPDDYEALCRYGLEQSHTPYPDPALWNRDGQVILWGSLVLLVEGIEGEDEHGGSGYVNSLRFLWLQCALVSTQAVYRSLCSSQGCSHDPTPALVAVAW